MKFGRDWTARALALAALTLAVGGGVAYAGTHYLITSTKQIKPSVLRSLRRPGPAGPQGPKGANGVNGTNGANGAVADYFASAGTSTPIVLTDVSLGDALAQPMISKTLPAGDYAITADVSIAAAQLNSSPGVNVVCVLKWAGVTQSESYTSPWDAGAGSSAGGAKGTLNWSVSLANTSQTTVTIGCADYSGPGSTLDVDSADISASGAINALQVGSIS